MCNQHGRVSLTDLCISHSINSYPIGKFFGEEEAKPGVRKEIKDLEKKFDGLLVLVQTSLKSAGVPLENLRLKVARLCMSQKQNIPLFNQSMLEEIDESSCDEILSFLTRMEVWDYLNF